jgi:hypothetical protein
MCRATRSGKKLGLIRDCLLLALSKIVLPFYTCFYFIYTYVYYSCLKFYRLNDYTCLYGLKPSEEEEFLNRSLLYLSML